MWLGSLANAIMEIWAGFLSNFYALIAMDPALWQAGESVSPWQLARDIQSSSIVMSVASSIMVTVWAVSFFRYVDSLHHIDLREVLGWVLRLALTYAVLLMSFDIMQSVMYLGLEINAGILDITGREEMLRIELPPELADGMAQAEASLESGSIFEKIGTFFSQLLPSLMLLVVAVVVVGCGLIIALTLFMRFFKMYIYIAISPIPLATFAGSATQEIAAHFLKSWLAMCLEICVISIAIGVFNASLSSGQGLLPALDAAVGEISSPDVLFYPVLKWAAGFLVKIVLLTSVVRGSDRMAMRIVGV
ncbi:MAG: hypothetical protein HDQ87_03615 [Clostridia bacterium]|nr:hypothetical protein [Clostridia bacterium]